MCSGRSRERAVWERKPRLESWHCSPPRPVVGGRAPGCGRPRSPGLGWDSPGWKVGKCLPAPRSPDCRAVSSAVACPCWCWGPSPHAAFLSQICLCPPAHSLLLPTEPRSWHVAHELREDRDASSLSELLRKTHFWIRPREKTHFWIRPREKKSGLS